MCSYKIYLQMKRNGLKGILVKITKIEKYGKYGNSSNSGENADWVKKSFREIYDCWERRSNLLCRIEL